MKNFLQTMTSILMLSSLAFADAAQPPAAASPTNAPATKEERKERREKRKEMREKLKEENKEMHEKVVQACSADVAATGCKEEPGKGLGKCIRNYKKEHKEFKISDSCKEALKDRREMHEEHHEMRKEMKDGQAPAEKK